MTVARSAFSLIELLAVIAIIGALLAFSLQAVRDAASRMSCQSQTKQIAMACIAHEGVHRTLPQGKTPFLAKDEPLSTSTWLVRILPFAEQNAVYDAALDHWNTMPIGSMNPPNWYRQEGALIAERTVRVASVTDGTSNTFLFGERPPSPDF